MKNILSRSISIIAFGTFFAALHTLNPAFAEISQAQMNASNVQKDGEFAAQLLSTNNEELFRKTWNDATNTNPPNLIISKTAKAGDTISAVVLFDGCRVNATNMCDVTAEFVVDEAGGKRSPVLKAPIWKMQAMPKGFSQLGVGSLKITFDDKDVLGNYTINAVIKDNVAGSTLKLSTVINLK